MKVSNFRIRSIFKSKTGLKETVDGKEFICKGDYRILGYDSDLIGSNAIIMATTRSKIKRLLPLLFHRGKTGNDCMKLIEDKGRYEFLFTAFPMVKEIEVDALWSNAWENTATIGDSTTLTLGDLISIEPYRSVREEFENLTDEDKLIRRKLASLYMGDLDYMPVSKDMFLTLQKHAHYYMVGTVRTDGKKTIVRHPFSNKTKEESYEVDSIPEGNTAMVFDIDLIIGRKDEVYQETTEQQLEAVA